jgi:hypothetical protein
MGERKYSVLYAILLYCTVQDLLLCNIAWHDMTWHDMTWAWAARTLLHTLRSQANSSTYPQLSKQHAKEYLYPPMYPILHARPVSTPTPVPVPVPVAVAVSDIDSIDELIMMLLELSVYYKPVHVHLHVRAAVMISMSLPHMWTSIAPYIITFLYPPLFNSIPSTLKYYDKSYDDSALLPLYRTSCESQN